MTQTYQALTVGTAGPSGGLLHLIRSDAEASLCGIPRTLLRADDALERDVCQDCIEWLGKRRDFSRQLRKVKPAEP
jgi:hypothetical protein